jgi:hypothetical protein
MLALRRWTAPRWSASAATLTVGAVLPCCRSLAEASSHNIFNQSSRMSSSGSGRASGSPHATNPDHDVARHRRLQSEQRLAKALKEMSRLRDLTESVSRGAAQGHRKESQLHEVRTAVQSVALTLTTREFSLASNTELFALLKTCNLANASGASHIAAGCLRVLHDQRLEAMEPKQVASLILFLAKHRRTLPASIVQTTFTTALQKLLQTPNDEGIGRIPLDRSVALLNVLRTSTLAPLGHGHEYLRQLIATLPDHKHELQPWHVAVVCQAICHYRYADREAVNFFIDAVDVCLANLSGFSGRDAAFILDAFASVGYIHTRLFLELGQLAGEKAEELADQDAARLINAFKKTEIDFSALQSSLETAMRMRPHFEHLQGKKHRTGSPRV